MRNYITLVGQIDGKVKEKDDGSVEILSKIIDPDGNVTGVVLFKINKLLYMKNFDRLNKPDAKSLFTGYFTLTKNAKGVPFIVMDVWDIRKYKSTAKRASIEKRKVIKYNFAVSETIKELIELKNMINAVQNKEIELNVTEDQTKEELEVNSEYEDIAIMTSVEDSQEDPKLNDGGVEVEQISLLEENNDKAKTKDEILLEILKKLNEIEKRFKSIKY